MTTRAGEIKIPQSKRDEEEYKKIEQEARSKRIRRIVNQVFGSEEGKHALRWLMEECGYQRPSVVVDPTSHEVNIQATVYNEGRRNLYLKLRGLIRSDILKDVENRGLADDDLGLFE